MYGWDSCVIILGLVADGDTGLARGMVENFWFEIEHYGAVLNANRTYYLTRSQPPFLTSMMRAVYEAPDSFPSAAARRAWLEHGYSDAQKDYETWLRTEHRAGTTGLARYYDFGEGPVPEMADDSTYYADVIRWLIAHPQQNAGLLVKGSAHPGPAGRRAPLATHELRHRRLRSLHARRSRGLPPLSRFLRGRPRHARVRLRHQFPLRFLSLEPLITTRPSVSTACSFATSATWLTSPIF